MPTTIDVIRGRVASVCAGAPFELLEAASPFDFDRDPTGRIDAAFRLTTQQGSVIGGFNYSEEHTDLIDIWVARKQAADPEAAYARLLADASSLRAAVIRDGLTAGGDYGVPDDGAGFSVNHDAGREFAVLRLTLPVNFEAQV